MSDQTEVIQARGKDLVLKPIEVVFNAVVDPSVLSGFFVSAGSGSLEEGSTIEWSFADVGESLEVAVTEVHRPHGGSRSSGP